MICASRQLFVHAIALSLLALWPATGGAQVSARADLLGADFDLSAAVFKAGAVATFPAALGADGVLAWPGAAVVKGSEQATLFFARQPLLLDTKISWQPFRIEIAPDSTLAIMVGVAVLDRAASDPIPAMHRIGRYLEVWKRVGGSWQLAAFSLVNILASGETIWNDHIGPLDVPPLPATGPAAAFIAADSTFSADAGALGASRAFAKWAAPDATTFSLTGELNTGPARIGAVLAGNTSHWEWGAVAAGSSADGMLGWTVGQATITAPGAEKPARTKYLTLWRRMPDGTIRFIADGGSSRP